MHQTVIIEEQLGTQPLRVLKDATTATVKINYPQDLTLHVVFEDAEGMVIFDLQRPETTIMPGVIDLPSFRQAHRSPLHTLQWLHGHAACH